jgi:CRISPR/Cas system-associated protein Csx1
MKQINVVTFQLKQLPDSMKIYQMFHVSLLESYHASIIPWWVLEPPSSIEVNGEQEYEVEEIFNFKLFNQQLQYLVHWKGYIWYMALANAFGNLLSIYQMPSTRWKKFIDAIQTNPRSFLMEHIVVRGGDVMNDIANIIISVISNIIVSIIANIIASYTFSSLLIHS